MNFNKILFIVILAGYAERTLASCAEVNIRTGYENTWANNARRLIQCNKNSTLLTDKSFRKYFLELADSLIKSNNQPPYLSSELLDEINNFAEKRPEIEEIKKSKFYQFIDQPHYSLLMNKFDIRLRGANDVPEDFKSEYFKPLLVGWAERNLALDPGSAIDKSFDSLMHMQAKAIKKTLGDGFQYLVGDPQCAVPNESLHQGCKVCDQYGVGTDDYYLCAIGYNWRLPLAWNGNGCVKISEYRNDCCGGYNLITLINTLKGQFKLKDGHNCRLFSRGCDGDYSSDPNWLKEIHRLLIAGVGNNDISKQDINFDKFRDPLTMGPEIAEYLKNLLNICFGRSNIYSTGDINLIRDPDAQTNLNWWNDDANPKIDYNDYLFF